MKFESWKNLEYRLNLRREGEMVGFNDWKLKKQFLDFVK